MKKLILISTSLFLLVFNTSFAKDDSLVPKNPRQERQESYGSIFNNKSFTLFGGGSDTKKATVNPYLWQASLDVISFMPIIVSDAMGGVIATDWYEEPESPSERYKVTILIKSIELKAHSIQVTAFKQHLREGIWRNAKANRKIAQDIEEKIFTRARELKFAQQHR